MATYFNPNIHYEGHEPGQMPGEDWIDWYKRKQRWEREQQDAANERRKAEEQRAETRRRIDAALTGFKETVAGQESLGDIFARLGQEYNLGGLRQTAFDVTQAVKNIPESVREVGRQFGVSAGRQERRIAKEQGELLPEAREAAERAQFAEGAVGQRLGMALEEQKKALTPYQVELEALSDRAAREVTKYTTDMQFRLSQILANIEQTGALTRQQAEIAANLALKEKEYENAKDLYAFKLAEQEKYKTPATTTMDIGSAFDRLMSDFGETSNINTQNDSDVWVSPIPDVIVGNSPDVWW